MTQRGLLIDQLLDEARRKGIYNPDSAGEPELSFDDMTHVDPADRVAYTMLKSNGFAPPFIEERTQLLAERSAFGGASQVLRERMPSLDESQRINSLHEMRRVLTDLWRRTLDYNLIAPPALQIEGIRVQYELDLITSTVTDARPDADGSVAPPPQEQKSPYR
jgi:hypothetical protein